MKVEFLITGTLKTWKHLIVHGAPAGIAYEVPVPVYLIEHNGKLILFDTGQIPPARPQSSDGLYIINMNNSDRAALQLAKRGINPKDLECIIISHAHNDHSDGLKDFPGVRTVIQRQEYKALAHYPQKWEISDGAKDLFDDGRIQCLPTPGHTDGHQSLLLKLDNGKELLLAADAVYTLDALKGPNLSSQLKKFLRKGIKIIPGHEPNIKKTHFP